MKPVINEIHNFLVNLKLILVVYQPNYPKELGGSIQTKIDNEKNGTGE